MITAVDTNVLLDVFYLDPVFGERSMDALRRCLREGRVVACSVVWAELAVAFPDKGSLVDAMDELGVGFGPIGLEAALAAGQAAAEYRRRGGRRDRVLADWLIHGHALREADRLLTRDRGFPRSYLPELVILDPTEG